MKKIREVIVVEGRYDKNTISQVVDATVVTLGGFSVFNDREKLAFLRRLAQERGLIVLTDSDGAGFVLRNYLKGALPRDRVKHAYIPDVAGKERRKRRPGKAGMLGVEGMSPEVLLEALRRCGATFDDESAEPREAETPITQADLYELGLTAGPPDSQRPAGGTEPAVRPPGLPGVDGSGWRRRVTGRPTKFDNISAYPVVSSFLYTSSRRTREDGVCGASLWGAAAPEARR